MLSSLCLTCWGPNDSSLTTHLTDETLCIIRLDPCPRFHDTSSEHKEWYLNRLSYIYLVILDLSMKLFWYIWQSIEPRDWERDDEFNHLVSHVWKQNDISWQILGRRFRKPHAGRQRDDSGPPAVRRKKQKKPVNKENLWSGIKDKNGIGS